MLDTTTDTEARAREHHQLATMTKKLNNRKQGNTIIKLATTKHHLLRKTQIKQKDNSSGSMPMITTWYRFIMIRDKK